MKKTRVIVECCLIIVTSVLALVIFDNFDKQKYDFFHTMPLEYQVNLNVVATTEERLIEIAKLAEFHSVIIMHKVTESKFDNETELTTYYLTRDQLALQAKRLNTIQSVSSFSTVEFSGITKINDFMDNDFYSYKLLTLEKIREVNNITIVAESEANFEDFIIMLAQIYPEGTSLILASSAVVSNDILIVVSTVAIIALVIVLLMDVFISLYYFMSLSKLIGVMSLLGKSKREIFTVLSFPHLKISFFLIIVIVVINFVFVSNITMNYMLILGFIFLLLYVTKVSLNFITFNLLINRKAKQALLKDKAFNKTAFKLTKILKASFSLLLIFTTLITYYVSNQIIILQSELHKHNELDEWTLISSFQPDRNYLSMNYENQLVVNQAIYEKLNIDYDVFYVQKSKIKILNHDYLLADLHYLKRFNIPITNEMSEGLAILIPSILREKENELYNQLSTYINQGYHLHYYNGGEFNTYEFYSTNYIVDNPIIMLYNFDSVYIFEMFGQGLNTALKINTQPHLVYESLYPVLQKYNIEQTFIKDSFVTLQEEKSNRLDFSLYTLYFVCGITMIILITHLLLIFNYTQLFVSKYKKELAT